MDIDTSDPEIWKKLLEKHAMNYKTAHDPEFPTSPISIKEKDYDFSVDFSLISIVENEPFCGKESDSVMHVKCIHELCIELLIFRSYLHHIRVISLFSIDFGNISQFPFFFWN